MSRLDRDCSVDQCAGKVWAREMCRKHYMRWHQHGDTSTVLVKQTPAGDPERFLDALPVNGEGCVNWPYAKNNMGYAQINDPVLGKGLVSRLVCQRRHGPSPSRSHVAAHSCGKGHEACIAPWHLSWKTPAENMEDARQHGTLSQGDHHARKLNSSDVLAIRRELGSAPQAEIAHKYGVSQTMVSHIARGVAWKSVGAA
jgi:hypothetical protein